MLTDAFFRRYEDVELFAAFDDRARRFLVQAAQIITTELYVTYDAGQQPERERVARDLTAAHDQLAREIGAHYLYPATFVSNQLANGTYGQSIPYSPEYRVSQYLTQNFEDGLDPNQFITRRLSLIELCFQKAAANIERKLLHLGFWATQSHTTVSDVTANLAGTVVQQEKFKFERLVVSYERHVHELNERFRQAKMPLSYHNNFIQLSDDALIERELERPFWNIVAAPKWAHVDYQMKEALDERDRGERNAVSNAMNALESTIKIISQEKGWTKGTEKGAANYIDNLVVERNGARFIAVWEKDALIKLFSDISNLFGHGPSANQPLPTLLPEQTAWAIDCCMVWIKSLVRRL